MIWTLLILTQFTDPGDTRPGGARQGVTHPVAAIVSTPSDRIAVRPRVFVYSRANCGACEKFATWFRGNGQGSFFEFAYKPAPEWVQAFPAFHWQANNGQWKVAYGWTGIETFRRTWENEQVAITSARPQKDIGKQAVSDTLRQFAGETGTIVFRPDRKQRATIADGVSLEVGEITARYDLSGAEPRLTFSEPQPRGTVERWGFGVGYVLRDAVYSPPEIRIGTNWKTVRISLEDER